MTFPDPAADRLRAGFRQLNRFMLLMWRLGLGPWLSPWPSVTGRILVLCHVGRRSGTVHRTPLNYAIVDGDVYVLAGFGARTDWYRNVMQGREVELWLPDGRWAASAEDVSEQSDRMGNLRRVLIGSGFAAYAFGVSPRLSDERLAEITAEYRLVRLIRTEPMTGPGGPGDLAWVWPLAILGLLVRGRRKGRRRSAPQPRASRPIRAAYLRTATARR